MRDTPGMSHIHIRLTPPTQQTRELPELFAKIAELVKAELPLSRVHVNSNDRTIRIIDDSTIYEISIKKL